MGSDKISSMKEAHLVLTLQVHRQDNTVQNILLELSKDELDHLIGSLEKAQRVRPISPPLLSRVTDCRLWQTANMLKA